ncbi:MAG TPA: NTP transferase domain-containing protein, partial [Candidatus Baltobacteraceae bacterium]|nr:NTP transferase domain-containing protein [Candidatus Baltobacteraceae bacterium]
APLARIADTLRGRAFVVVTATTDVPQAMHLAPGAAAYVTNDEPDRGMTHSLRCALTRIAPDRAIGVLLADVPFITAQTIARIESELAPSIDVAYPTDRDGAPGHPVIFAASLRARLEALPDGDTLRALRDDPQLRRARVLIEDRGAFYDLDRPSQWHAQT